MYKANGPHAQYGLSQLHSNNFQELKTTTVELLFQVKDTDTVTLEDAIELLQYPKILVCVYLSCSCWCYLFKLGPMMFYFPAGKTS